MLSATRGNAHRLFLLIAAVLTAAAGGGAQTTAQADPLLARLNSADAQERHKAIINASDERVVSADVLLRLVELSQADPDPIMRNQALTARQVLAAKARNGELTGPRGDAVRAALLAAAERGEPARRAVAIGLLPDFVGDAATSTLKRLAEADEPSIQTAALHARVALAQGDARRDLLINGLKSRHAAVVDAAAAHLGTTAHPAYISALRELERDPAAAGLWASLMLARWGQRIDRPASVLAPLLESDRPWVRAAAARALTRSGEAELKLAIDSLSHPNLDVRLELADALSERFDHVTADVSRMQDAVVQEVYEARDRAAALRGLKRHGLKAAAAFPQLRDLLASERAQPANKPLADAAIVALQDLFQLAAETEARSKDVTATQPKR